MKMQKLNTLKYPTSTTPHTIILSSNIFQAELFHMNSSFLSTTTDDNDDASSMMVVIYSLNSAILILSSDFGPCYTQFELSYTDFEPCYTDFELCYTDFGLSYTDLFCCIVRFFQRPILSLALSTNRPRTNNQCSQPHNLMKNHPLIMFGKLCNFRFRLKQITNQLLE